MEWIILIVLVPAVIVPVVLLFGFAGCGSVLSIDDVAPPPDVPFNLQAIAVGERQINLKWDHNSAAGVEFVISLLGPEGSWNENYKTVVGQTSAESTSLVPGTHYFFRVRARQGGVESAASSVATAKTWKWETTYEQALSPTGGMPFSGDCLVQRIGKGRLKFSGTRIKVWLRGSTPPLVIQSAYVSKAVPPTGIPGNTTPNLWDPNTDLTPILTSKLTLQANTPVPLPEIEYALTNTEDLILAFDIEAGVGLKVTGPDVATCTSYIKNGSPSAPVTEAGSPNRSATGWPPSASTVFLVEKIDVLTP